MISDPFLIACPLACIRPLDSGRKITLTALPTPGYEFTNWQVANHGQDPFAPGPCGTSPVCQLTVDQAKDVVANFDGSFLGRSNEPHEGGNKNDERPPPPCEVDCAGSKPS